MPLTLSNAKVVFVAMFWLLDLSYLQKEVRRISNDLYYRSKASGGDSWSYDFEENGAGAPDLDEVTFEGLTLDELEVIHAGLAGFYMGGPDDSDWEGTDPNPRSVLRACRDKAADKLIASGRTPNSDGYDLWQDRFPRHR